MNTLRQMLKGITSVLTIFPETPKISLKTDKEALESDCRNIQEDFSKIINEDHYSEKQLAIKILQDLSEKNFDKLIICDKVFIHTYTIIYDSEDGKSYYVRLEDNPRIPDERSEISIGRYASYFNEAEFIIKDRGLKIEIKNRIYLLYRLKKEKSKQDLLRMILSN